MYSSKLVNDFMKSVIRQDMFDRDLAEIALDSLEEPIGYSEKQLQSMIRTLRKELSFHKTRNEELEETLKKVAAKY